MNNTNKKLIGLTGILASAVLGAHLLFNTQKGKKNLKHIKSWAFKMKGEMLERLEKIKDDIDQDKYHALVDELGEKYKKVKGMTLEEVTELGQELKTNWKKLQLEAKKILNDEKTKTSKSTKSIISTKSTKKLK